LKPSKVRVGVETAFALFAGQLAALTIFWPDWVETLAAWDLDRHDGSVEWLIIGTLLAAAFALGIAARRHWRLLFAASDCGYGTDR